MSKDTRTPTTKWTDKDFDYPVKKWKPPQKLLYPCFDTERSALEQLITDFAPLPPYDTSSVLQGMQPAAETQKRLVSVPYTVPKGYHAFLEIVRKLIAAGVDTTDWKQKFLGYLAARHPAESDTQWEIAQGTGSELSAIRDYHFIGKLLAEIIDALAGTHWEQEALAAKLQNALNTEIDTGATYLSEIHRGVIGVKIWRKARYLNVSKTPEKFCLELITDFYRCSVKQHKGVFSIHDEKHLDLFNDALNAFLYHQNSAEDPDIGFTDTPIGQTLTVQKLPEMDTPKQALYAEVKKLFADGVSIMEIVDRTGVSRRKVFDVTKCQRIRKKRNADTELRDRAEKELESGASLTVTAKTLGISRRKLKRILETGTGAKVQKKLLIKSTYKFFCTNAPVGESDAAPKNATRACLDTAFPVENDEHCDAASDAASDAAPPESDAAKIPRDDCIIELHTAEHSNRKIAAILISEGYEKVSEGTVRRVVIRKRNSNHKRAEGST